ncbi:MAG TPA: hypothetical protein VK461_15290, partial [Acidimicrobiales bacterium]|nr:hypothetical protein [Acidimicrobiales bacterium]
VAITLDAQGTSWSIPPGGSVSAQHVVLGAPALGLVGTAVTLSPSSTSGLPVVIALDPSSGVGVCTVSGSTVSFKKVGTCVIDGDQAGDASHLPGHAQTTIPVKKGQTISFGSVADKKVNQPPFTVRATASSRLAVTFTSTTPLVCGSGGASGEVITLLSSGVCTVVADQAGDATFAAAPSVSRSFQVNKLNQTVTIPTVGNKKMTASPVTVSASASSGLPVTLSSSTPSVCSIAGTSVTLWSPGTCTLRGDQPGDGTYNPAPTATRSFTVSKANQSITFVSPGKQKLAASPVVVSPTASSGLPVAVTSTNTAVCTVAGDVVTLLTKGTCTLKADQAGNAAYNAAPTVTRSFAVT